MNKQAIFEYNHKKYCFSDILTAIKSVGIRNGDSIFVHSDLKSFGRINGKITKEKFIEAFIKALRNAVGTKGNIIMPTFSYSFCKKEIFDLKSTPSAVGIMTESFRKIRGAKRSIDPIFSVAALGPDNKYFTNVGRNCFGKDSIFEKLYEKNVKILFLGETFDITYMHFVEQKLGVPYRFIKKFKGNIRLDEGDKEFTFEYYVRYLDKNVDYNLEKIASYLDECGILKKANLGYSKVRAVAAIDAFNALTAGLKKDIYLLLKDKPDLS